MARGKPATSELCGASAGNLLPVVWYRVKSVNAQRKEAQWQTNYLATNTRLARQTNAERFRRYAQKCSLIPSANQTALGQDTKSFASQRSAEGILRVTKLSRKSRQTLWYQLLCRTAIYRPCRRPARTSIAPPASRHTRVSNLPWRSSTEKIVRQPRCQSGDENHQHHHDCFGPHEHHNRVTGTANRVISSAAVLPSPAGRRHAFSA